MSSAGTQTAIANLMMQRSALRIANHTTYGFYPTVTYTGNSTERNLGTLSPESETVDLKQLRDEVTRLTNVVAAQHESIKQLWEIIDGIRQNSTGQRVNKTQGYWEETRY